MSGVIVRQKVKELAGQMSVSKDYYPQLEELVTQLIEKSKNRAQNNGRTTIMARDL
ncbi:MAG: hypothetical protein ACMXYF_02720 [Candidatus Woesearchaeota archaeon]